MDSMGDTVSPPPVNPLQIHAVTLFKPLAQFPDKNISDTAPSFFPGKYSQIGKCLPVILSWH